MRHRHLLSWIKNQPWAIEPGKAAEILAVLKARVVVAGSDGVAAGRQQAVDVALVGGVYSRASVIALIDDIDQATTTSAERMHPARERALRNRDGSTAVIPIHGVMAQRRMPGVSTGGGADTEKVGRAIDKAVADSAIKAIVLHIDSPGGSVEGTAELADKVRAARDRKPVIAQVDSQAASAAYWVASQATEIVSTTGGSVGSIGVVALHEDISAMLEQEGVKPTLISAGKYKVEGNPFVPLDDEAREHFQALVDDAYRDFVAAVAAGRGVSTKTVESDYGQGRVLFAKKALAAGMIDRTATFDQTMARFRAPQPSIQRRARAAQAIARTS